MDTNEEVVLDTESKEEGDDVVSISKAEYDKLNQTLGSMKRELKDLKKSKETIKEPKETPKEIKTEEFGLPQKSYLRAAGITHPEDVELAKTLSKKWGMDVDVLVDDEDFKSRLERQQNTRIQTDATSNIKGGGGTNSAKNTADYWLAKGQPPTPDDVPDTKARRAIIRQFMENKGSSKKFYND